MHDRIQQAAYSLILDEQKSSTHYQLGQLLFKEASNAQKYERIFEIVNNLNYGIDSITDEDERIHLASLNLMAARKAKQSIAYSAAVEYLNLGIKFLGKESWENEYQLTFNLHQECSEAEYLKGNLERSEILAYQTLDRARTAIDKAKIYNILIIQYTVTAKYQAALNEGIMALKLLDIQWDEANLSKEMNHELKLARNKLGNRKIASLIDLPEMEIPEKRSAIELLHNLLPSAFSINQPLWSVLVVKMVNLSLQYGHISECCFGYSFYGVLMSSMLGDYESGYEFGLLSLNLSQKFGDSAQQSKACNILSAFLLHWKKHIRHCKNLNQEGYACGLESGQLQFVGYITYNRILSLFHSGYALSELLPEFPVYLPVLKQIQHYYAYDITVGCQLAISALVHSNLKKIGSQSQYLEEKKYIKRCKNRDSFPAICIYEIIKGQILYLFEQPQIALESLLSAKELLHHIAGHFIVAEHIYYQSLVSLQLYRSVPTQEKPKLIEWVRENKEQLTVWAKNCPENFRHKLDLVEAETARNHQENAKAIELYDRAIAGAKENDFIQDEALANELAAKFYLDWGKEKVACGYMQEAYYCYARWGAKAKTDALEQRYPNLLQPILQAATPTLNPSKTLTALATSNHSIHAAKKTSCSSTSSVNTTLDFAAILKASQTLSSTIQLDELLRQLTQIILQNAGGDRCALILPKSNGKWSVAAIATPEATELYSEPLQNNPRLPVRLIQYVKNTQEMVVVNDLNTDLPVIDDYLHQRQPKSLLCLPIFDRGKTIGILYLKNRSTSGAFTEDRILVLNFLCTQAAISLENARLYRQAQDYAQQLERSQLQLVQNEKMSALGNLVTGVAHEINNPVGFIGGNLQPARDYVQDLFGLIDLYQEKLPHPDEELEDEIEAIDLDFLREDLPKLIDSMKLGVERIAHISTSLRTFSRTDKEHKVPFNLHEGIDSTLLILKHRLKANEQRPAIEIVKEYGNLPEIQCFPGQLNQVFMNLIANAIDALDEGNGDRSFEEISANPNRITIQTDIHDEEVTIRISDNGVGMSEEVQKQIFEQGFTTKSVGKGTGLGMAIARQIIEEKHGGTISCTSKPGEGTEFAIALPTL